MPQTVAIEVAGQVLQNSQRLKISLQLLQKVELNSTFLNGF